MAICCSWYWIICIPSPRTKYFCSSGARYFFVMMPLTAQFCTNTMALHSPLSYICRGIPIRNARCSDICISSCRQACARFCRSVYATDPYCGYPHKVQAGNTVSSASRLSGLFNSSTIQCMFSSGLLVIMSCWTIWIFIVIRYFSNCKITTFSRNGEC